MSGLPGEQREQREQSEGVALAEMLRRWWEQAEPTPTQESLARRVGVNQASLSRYLNPRRDQNAPPHVIELLHKHLGAPAEELDQALALHAALTGDPEAKRPGPGGGGGRTDTVHIGVAPLGPTPVSGAVPRSAALLATRFGRGAWGPIAVAVSVVLVIALGVWWVTAGSGTGDASSGVSGDASASAGAAADLSQWQLTLRGHWGWRARTVQHLLVAHGYELEVDGKFGPKTEAAVKAFQSRHGLVSDGKVGPKTWPLLVRVDTHADRDGVMALQELLHNLGMPLDVTGVFTSATAQNLSAFQRDHQLPETGEADPATWRALMAVQPPPVSSRPSSAQPS